MGFKTIENPYINYWALEVFNFEIFHSMHLFTSNFELATKLWYSFIAEATFFLTSVELL
jgi:hypothetical protein